jgi:hypothetical protein
MQRSKSALWVSAEGTAVAIAGWRGTQYDGIVAFVACGYFKRGPGVGLMIVVMLVAGIACLLAGFLAIGLGVPVKEFSFGNTLILTGAVAACTGLVILALWVVVRELQNIARRLGPSETLAAIPRHPALEGAGASFGRDQYAAEGVDGAAAPWQDQAARGARSDVPSGPEPTETAPAAKPKRNLMFSSSSRRERERAQARAADPSASEPHSAPAATSPAPEINEAPPPTFEDAWPKSDRSRSAEVPPQRRSGRAPSTFSEPAAGAVGADRPPRPVDQPPVTVLKSGVVDGMAYSLYSDGSIEAQMPEGMMRFASIDELRSHLDHRPG